MAWSAGFITELRAPMHRIEYTISTVLPLVGSAPGVAASFGGDDVVDYQEQGDSVQTGSWQSSLGSFSFTLLVDSRDVLAAWKRGTWLKVEATINGVGPEVIRLGRISRMWSNEVGVVNVDCLDWVSSMSTRPAASNPENLAMFTDTEATEAVTQVSGASSYTVNSGFLPQTLSVVDASGFKKSSGGYGMVRVTDGTSGDVFYLQYDVVDTVANTLQIREERGLGVTPPAGVIVTGSNVKHIAWIPDSHPLDTVKQIVTSTGAGTNGADDQLPATWSMGLDSSLVDTVDIGDQKAQASITGAYVWDLYAEQEVGNSFTFLTNALAQGGFFIANRQGLITARTGVFPHTSGVPLSSIIIGDDDIEAVNGIEHDFFDPDITLQAGGVKVIGNETTVYDGGGVGGGPTIASHSTSRTNGGTASFPARRYFHYRPAFVYAAATIDDILIEIRDRLFGWAVQCPERVSLRCTGLRLAQLTVGDIVRVTSRDLIGRLESGSGSFNERKGFVAHRTVIWEESRVELEILFPPTEADVTS